MGARISRFGIRTQHDSRVAFELHAAPHFLELFHALALFGELSSKVRWVLLVEETLERLRPQEAPTRGLTNVAMR